MANGLNRAVDRATNRPLLNPQLNRMVRKYRELLQQQRDLKKEMDETKKDLMNYDGITTDKYVIEVLVTPTERVVGKETLFDVLGEEEVRKLGFIKNGESRTLKIGDK